MCNGDVLGLACYVRHGAVGYYTLLQRSRIPNVVVGGFYSRVERDALSTHLGFFCRIDTTSNAVVCTTEARGEAVKKRTEPYAKILDELPEMRRDIVEKGIGALGGRRILGGMFTKAQAWLSGSSPQDPSILQAISTLSRRSAISIRLLNTARNSYFSNFPLSCTS